MTDVKDMTTPQIMRTFGVSRTTARRYKKEGIPQGKNFFLAPAPADTTRDENISEFTELPGAAFIAEQAPDNIFPEEKPLDKVFKALGLNAKKTEEKKDKVFDPKLNKAQQSIFDSFSPLAVALFVFCAGWVWTKIDAEIGSVLAPDKNVAEKIVHPLVRIYARHSKIAAALEPDTVDFSASMAALVGYAWTSLSMYQQIKKEQELGIENTQARNEQGNSNGSNGDYKPSPLQNGHDGANHRRYATRADSSEHGANNGSVGFATDFNPGNLTPDERRQYEALSKLRSLDIASRARRSGRS